MIELFSGSAVMSDTFKRAGFDTCSIDNNPDFLPDICCDVLDMIPKNMPQFDILWASPPCQAFSVASISSNWTGGKGKYIPKSDTARLGIKLLQKTIELIKESRPKYWFIENPRGVMRKLIDLKGLEPYKRVTVTYCQYGDKRMKPTDIWTNAIDWYPKKMCKNGDKCHEAAPRGSKTGTQGLKNDYERGKIPQKLCDEIVEIIKPKARKNP